MATRREKDEARKAKKGAAADSGPDEASEALLATVQGDDLDVSSSSSEEEEAADGSDEGDLEEQEKQEEGGEAEVSLARQLGAGRYVMAGFFAAGILGAYVLGKAIHGLWAYAANRDWFNRAVPVLAAVQ